jgi:hypothetical protein
VDKGATFVMNGGVVNNICDWTPGIYNEGTTTINAGTVTAVHSTLGNEGGTMIINDGDFTCNGVEGKTQHVLYATSGSATTINGGTFNGKDNYNGFNVDAGAGAVVNIYGGNFLPVHSGSLYGEGTISVSGGIFFDDPSARVADGYKAVESNGVYLVVSENAITSNDELIAAINAGKTGKTASIPKSYRPRLRGFNDEIAKVMETRAVTRHSDIKGKSVINSKKSFEVTARPYTSLSGRLKASTFIGNIPATATKTNV